jgi:hypothetical protein
LWPFALLTGVILGLVVAALLLIFEPRTVESILDMPILSGTERVFELTARANEQRATQSALELSGTQQALWTREAALNQAATQNAYAFVATRTAAALQNAQGATQAAFYLQGTQAALILYATRIQAESAQQQFQGEIDQTATQLAIYASATQAQLAADFFNTLAAQDQMATATAAAPFVLPPAAVTPAG